MAQVFKQAQFTLPAGATHMIVVRHGESEALRSGQRQPLVDGHGDPPLDARGHEQARKVAERLARQPVAAIYVSNLQRTSQTAAPLVQATGLTPVVEPDLRELYLGEWEGGVYRMKRDENHPDWQRVQEQQSWDLIPGVEPAEEFAARLRSVVTRITGRHPDQRICVFAHGGVIGMLTRIATDGRMFAFAEADNASITHFVVDGQRWRLRRFNDTSHLGADLDMTE